MNANRYEPRGRQFKPRGLPTDSRAMPPESSHDARPAPPRQREIRPLTSLRFFAALLVFGHHIVNYVMLHVHPGVLVADMPRSLAMFRQGHSGVTFFFVLSGFVLAYVHAGTLRRIGVRAVGRFYVARLARIYPLHVATFLLFIPAAVIGASSPSVLAVGAITNLALVQAFVPLGGIDGVVTSYNGVAWSLSAELFFYALFPFLLFILARVLDARPRRLLAVGVGLWLAVTGSAAAFAGDAWAAWFFDYFPVVHLASFIVGMCLGLGFLGARRAASASASLRPSRTRSGLVELLATAAFIGSMGLVLLLPMTMRPTAAMLPATAWMIWTFAHERSLISRLLQSRLLVYLGELSFGFYMLHLGVLVAASQAGLFSRVPALPLAVALFAVSIAGAAVSFHWFETPARRWVRRRGNAWVDDLDVRLVGEDRGAEAPAAGRAA